jgi:hypothetical protein
MHSWTHDTPRRTRTHERAARTHPQVLRVPRACRQRYVPVGARHDCRECLVAAVHAEGEDAGVARKDRGRAVALVHVQV